MMTSIIFTPLFSFLNVAALTDPKALLRGGTDVAPTDVLPS
jgi:hypothetical protein